MPKYVIEREIPNPGSLSPSELQGISQTSCSVLLQMGPQAGAVRVCAHVHVIIAVERRWGIV
jgi:hypothetical protein